MNEELEQLRKNWSDWSFEGTEDFQFRCFKALSLDEKLDAAEELCDCVEMFREMRERPGLPRTEQQ